MKCVLLGGSNSVLRNSIRLGLEENFEVTNYALGATTFIQNMMELVRNKEVIDATDFIITESNVNDTLSLSSLNISKEWFLYLLDEYYRLLFNTKKYVICVILPTNPKQEKKDDLIFINELHKTLCSKYGFEYIHFDDIMPQLNSEQIDLLLPHPRHFNEAYIYHMSLNLSNYIKSKPLPLTDDRKFILSGPDYYYLKSSDMVGSSAPELKSNHSFSAEVINIKTPVKFPSEFNGKILLAVSIWCDGYSSLVIGDQSIKTIKNFSHLYTCAELIKQITITTETTVSLNNENSPPTEKTVLANYDKNEKINDMKLEGFLLCNYQNHTVSNVQYIKKEMLDISKIVMPNWRPFAAALKSFIEQNNYLSSKSRISC